MTHCIQDCGTRIFKYDDDCACKCLFCEGMTIIGGRYEIEAPLGFGAFSEVYQAKDIETGNRVALKRRTEEESSAAFLRAEAATLAALNHHRIARFHALTDDRYLVEELFHGITLSAFVEQRVHLSEPEVRTILLGLLDVLEYVHDQGVVHRDIRPQNILVDHHGHVVALLDFGLAQREGVPSLGRDTFAEPYAAPERWRRAHVGPTSDLFSAAIVAEMCLVGDHQFRKSNHPWEWYLNRNPVSPEFKNLLEQMTKEHVSERFSRASEVRNAIEALPPCTISTHTAPTRLTLNGYTVSIEPTGSTAAVVTFEGDIEIINVDSGEVIRTISIEEEILVARFSPDRSKLVGGGTEGTLYVWNSAFELVRTRADHRDSIQTLSFAKDAGVLVSASNQGELRVWRFGRNLSSQQLRTDEASLSAVACSDDGRFVAGGDSSGILYLWDLDGETNAAIVGRYSSALTAVAFVPGSHTIVAGLRDGTIHMSNARARTRLFDCAESEASRSPVRALVFTDTGELLECREDALVRVWDLTEKRITARYHHPGQPLQIDEAQGVIATVGYGSVQILR